MTPSEFQRSLTSLPQSRTGLACLALGHWPLTSGHSPLATACVLWLRFRLAGSGTDGSTSSGNEFCVDSGLASFGAFCGARHSSCVGSLLPPDSLATTTGHWPLTTGHWPLFRVRLPRSQPAPIAAPFRFTGHWSLATGHYSRAPRPTPLATTDPPKSTSFACPIPPWFVLRCDLPKTNIRDRQEFSLLTDRRGSRRSRLRMRKRRPANFWERPLSPPGSASRLAF